MTTVLYLVGEPGVGKTTLARTLMPGLGFESYLVPKPKWTVGALWCAAGHYTGDTFDGADTIPYSGASDAIDHWAELLASTCPLTLLDGDRLSHESAAKRFQEHADRLTGVLLTAPPEVASERRRQRGSNQAASWVKGRKTKAERFAESLPDCLQLDATLPTSILTRMVLEYLGEDAPCGPADPHS